ncbi:hypothetical protein COCVIDRAFT_107177 [Bipolaris victoriae FI3]|uniref:Uncharacterized protein n=2 Tax=Bipolaris TaxID=33194 RepID=W6YDL5_COCC2|nr:uncharacterized protein COCCADRAFT_106947 [Bipolaris zeicola 26-R-13]XP_014553614.1 hypothetical protein COCVIDRAFT_107177 [Bipolaris victoriae FI3]EUC29271.1 hypothetical protein COCCADRAFT_106947 [Bipolaris zeicola 26-R-13]
MWCPRLDNCACSVPLAILLRIPLIFLHHFQPHDTRCFSRGSIQRSNLLCF